MTVARSQGRCRCRKSNSWPPAPRHARAQGKPLHLTRSPRNKIPARTRRQLGHPKPHCSPRSRSGRFLDTTQSPENRDPRPRRTSCSGGRSTLTKIAMSCLRLPTNFWGQPAGITIEFCEFLQILKFVAVDIMPARSQQLSSPLR